MTQVGNCEVFGRQVHPATGNSVLPRQASGLYYNNAKRGEAFLDGFFVAREATSMLFPCSLGTIKVIMNDSFCIGLLRRNDNGLIRTLTYDELERLEKWHNAKQRAARNANLKRRAGY